MKFSTKFTASDVYYNFESPITIFEMQYGRRGTHIPTDKPRTYIGIAGEILIDDEISKERPYAKIGDGKTSFDGLEYVKVIKDYYGFG